MEKKSEIYGLRLLGIGLAIFLGGIYVMPEKIKIFAAIYVFLLVIYYLMCFSGKVHVWGVNVLWISYVALGTISAIICELSKFGDVFEFILSIMIGMIASSMYMTCQKRESQIGALKFVVGIALIGCFLQVVSPEILSNITRFTLGEDKYLLFEQFASWDRIVGFSYQTGVTAHYLCMFELILMSIYMTSGEHDVKKIRCIVLFVIGIVLILFTEKRSSLIAVFVILLLLLFMFNRKQALKIVGGTTLLVCGAWIVIVCTEMGKKMLARTMGSNPFTGRLEIYEILWEMTKDNPVFGNGFGSTLVKVTEFTNGHNIYMQTLAECGIIGAGILLLILGYNYLQGRKVLKYMIQNQNVTYIEVFVFAYQVYFIIMGFMGNVLYDVYPLVVYMIATGVIRSIQKEKCGGKVQNERKALY